MSLTTVASNVLPDETLKNLPPSRPERFQPSDFIAAGLVFLVTLGVYIATLAPSVTLEDSGELITAATKFGVGHPPGYPLWTVSGFILSHIFPFGNLAWRINLQSAIFGAFSNGVLTLLVCHSGRWLVQRWTDEKTQEVVRPFCFYAGMFSGLTIGFSDVMWSQATIAAVHGTIQALILNLVLLFFYLWLLEPQKSRRLVLTVLVFSLGLTNHHTLVQIIPAFLLAAFLTELVPHFLEKKYPIHQGLFFSVFLGVNLFSLSILVYISWLSGNLPNHPPDEQFERISEAMARLILITTIVVSFFYVKEFRLKLFLLGVATALVIFAYGHYLMGASTVSDERWRFPHSLFSIGSFVHPGWLQITTWQGVLMLVLTALALGLLYTSILNRRLVIGIFIVGWLGIMPYAYEPFASSTNPPMNWGFTSERSGFYYEVTRQQYPKALPTLIKMTIGKAIGVVDPRAQLDATIGLPDYFPRLGKTFYYYGFNVQQNFTAPLIFLILAALIYIRRSDWPQINWLIFLGAAFFFLAFMLQLIAPQEAFDLQHILQYKVFHLQSHCILVILMGYGALAAMTYLHETMSESVPKNRMFVFSLPAIFLSLMPLWSNFDNCSQAGHWFGYMYGTDMMRDMDKNAVYFGGSDAGRFVPTYMAFVESQQDDYWKHEPFDRRDVAVITQNALCDTYYTQYIRNQYDNRFRPKPDSYTPFEKWLGRDKAYPTTSTTCISDDELFECWQEYDNLPETVARVKMGGPAQRLRPGTNDVFVVNGLVARKIFDKNKKDHTFYIEQSVPIDWMYPYLLPWGLILKLNPTPMDSIPQEEIEKDRKFWDAYSAKLLANPRFRMDNIAVLNFSKLAYFHSDLYRYRNLPKEQEYWLRIALALGPQMPDAVGAMTHLLVQQRRFDEALTVAESAAAADPASDSFVQLIEALKAAKLFGKREDEVRAQLAKAPYDVNLNLELARLLEDEGKFGELNDRLRSVAGMTNWSHEDMANVVRYYVDQVHDLDAAIAFLEVRAKIEPQASEVVYNLAALHATQRHYDAAIKYLNQAAQYGGTNAIISAGYDPRFQVLHDDPRFQALLSSLQTNAPAASPKALPPTKNPPAVTPPPGAKK
jgi:tetratricopeptide (TPR) repeat protein